MYGFPNSLCTSINEQVVHGIPNDRPLEDGDIISIDCGVLYDEYYGDHAYTFEVGEVAPETKQLLEVTKASLYIGIEAMKRGNRVGDIGYAIQRHCESHGYGVVRELVGHGLGKKLHEDPQVPNYGKRGSGKLLQDGMVLAIEPMINLGTHRVRQLNDGWSIITGDKKPSAHFEHDVALVDGRPVVLSTLTTSMKPWACPRTILSSHDSLGPQIHSPPLADPNERPRSGPRTGALRGLLDSPTPLTAGATANSSPTAMAAACAKMP